MPRPFFIALDESDYMIMTKLQRKSKDFRQLEDVDQKVLVWSLAHQPKRIQSYLDYISIDYRTRKQIDINKGTLMKVLDELLH